MATKVSEEYKYRISCKMNYPANATLSAGKTKASEFEFRYPTMEQARKNYKAILLGLYKKKDLEGFSICLNRLRDRKWSKPIYKEKVPD
jgi:hypothetical protein